jgi:hypothetical protein
VKFVQKAILAALVLLASVYGPCLAHLRAQNVEGQIIAAEYGEFQVPGQTIGGFQFPSAVCQVSGGGKNFSAFATGRAVKIVDGNPAHTEIATPSSVYIDTCSVNMATTYTHVPPYYLTSGTGGLQEAITANQQGIAGPNSIILNAEWYQLITPRSAATVIASIQGNTQLSLVDVTTTPYTWYQWNGSRYVVVAVSAGSGVVSLGAAFHLGAYPFAGTTIGPAPNLYAITPSMTVSQINTLFASLTPNDCVVIPPGVGQIGWTNSQGACAIDLRVTGWPVQAGAFVACDVAGYYGTVTEGTNTINIGSNVAIAGQTVTIAKQTGYGVNGTQQFWTPTVVSYTFPNITLSANAPFTFTGFFQIGTDNTTALDTAFSLAGLSHPIEIPSGCKMLTQKLAWTGQSIIGQVSGRGGFVGFPAQDILQQPDTSGQSATAQGLRLENVGFYPDPTIDITRPSTGYNAAGTPTSVNAVYRPIDTQDQTANNPLAPGWCVGCTNGVASITQNSAVICYPTTAGAVAPVVGDKIIFPYQTAVFVSTISSLTGSGCTGGTSPATMAAAFPNTSGYTVAQAEWFQGTAIQSTTTTISASPSYPFTITMNLSTAPIPGFESNVASHGTIKFGSTTCEYLGNDYNDTLTIRQCQNIAAYSGTTYVFPLNPCPAAVNTPWPVVPTQNSGDSTPSGAVYYPGQCVGNAAISFPQANGNTYAGTGLSGAYLHNIYVSPVNAYGQNTNNTAGLYFAGNTPPYDTIIDQVNMLGTEFCIVQGPASAGQHGVHLAGPTGAGNTISNITCHAAHPFVFVDLQQSNVERLDAYVTAINPYDGSTMGASTWLVNGITLDEQAGNAASVTAQDDFSTAFAEPEAGNLDEVPVSAELDCITCTYRNMIFEGGFNMLGGSQQKVTGGQLSAPVIIYGAGIDIEAVSGLNIGYITNAWPSNYMNWGEFSSCSSYAGGANGPLISCGPGLAEPYKGRTVESAMWGANVSPIYNPLGGMIQPGEWGSPLSPTGMTVDNVVDPTEPAWGKYAGCNLNPDSQCLVEAFDGFNGYIYIGPFNRIAPAAYRVEANYKSATAPGQVTLAVAAYSPGGGLCPSPPGTVASIVLNATTSWQHVSLPVNFSGAAGCTLAVQLHLSSTTDQYRLGQFDLIPAPAEGGVPGAITAPTEGATCSRGSSWLGAFNGYTYFCDYNSLTVKRAPIS